MPLKRNQSSTSENEEEKKKAPKITPQVSSPARTTTNTPTTYPPATPVPDATNTPNTTILGVNNPYNSPCPAGAAAYAPTTPPRATTVTNSNSTTHPSGIASNAPTTPLRGTTSGTFHLSPIQLAVVDARKNRATALQAHQKAMEYSKLCFRRLRNAKLSYQKSVEQENYLREKIQGYDLNINVMQQIDTSLHASKNGGTQKFTINLTTPIKSVKEEDFSDDDEVEMLHHVVTGVGEKPADGVNAKAGMKTTGETLADYDDIDGGKPIGKEGDGVNTTDEEAADAGNANTGMKTTGEEPSDSKKPDGGKTTGKDGGDANVSKK